MANHKAQIYGEYYIASCETSNFQIVLLASRWGQGEAPPSTIVTGAPPPRCDLKDFSADLWEHMAHRSAGRAL